jgi:tRNA(Leu) C34 or U34 (ribose-2'-O)-methylase TrmL
MTTTIQDNEKPMVCIGLTNPKSPTNVGAVMRAAGCFNVDKVFFTGRRYEQAAQFNKGSLKTDTKNAQNTIPLVKVDDFESIVALREKIPSTIKIVCVDLVEGAMALPHFNHPQQALYIFGPEDGTIKQTMIDSADDVVYVPTEGCMNLAASVNVILYDRLSKLATETVSGLTDNALIRRSRDTNNKVKVKL